MKEFCNFQNCGLSFTLFNKLVWALIMENGCTEKESERELERERDTHLAAFGFTSHFSKYAFAVCSSGTFCIIVSVLVRQQSLDSNRKSWKNGYLADMRYVKVHKWNQSISLSAMNAAS